MMDFITIPTVMGIITLGVYRLFELFVCRKERMALIEKLADKFNAGDNNGKLSFNLNYSRSRFAFGALKGGMLMLGIGLGLLIAFFICCYAFPDYVDYKDNYWRIERQAGIVYGACVLLFGGAGLLTAFLIETKIKKKEIE